MRILPVFTLLLPILFVLPLRAQTDKDRLQNSRALSKTIVDHDEDTALSILEKDFILNGESPDSNPLINAIYNGHSEIVKLLKSFGAKE